METGRVLMMQNDGSQILNSKIKAGWTDGLYRNLFENMGSIVLIIEPVTGDILDANRAACSFYGYSHAALTQLKIADLNVLPPEEVWTLVRKIAAGEITHMTVPHRQANGEVRQVEVRLGLLDYEGQKANIAVINDVTTRILAQADLKESEGRYKSHYKNLPIPTYTWQWKNDDLSLIDFNDAALVLSSSAVASLLGRSARDMFRDDPGIVEDMLKCFTSRKTLQGERSIRMRASGEQKDLELTFVFLDPDLVVVHARDITTRKQADESLKSISLELRKALAAKDEFLAAMSHELRTPLTVILGFAEAMQLPYYGSLTEKQLKAVASIEKNSQRLMNIFNDILDYTKLQSGVVPIEMSPCPLSTICNLELQAITPMAEKKRQRVHFTMTPDVVTLHLDEKHIHKILHHLLENASKFTPEDGEFGLDVTGNRDEHQVKITVWDGGIGIQESDLPRLFKPFLQLDARLARQYEGAGLGLALVGQLVNLLGGSIGVESVLGQGSRFTVTLPWTEEISGE
jgi:PAS domain S-box-containing protein